MEFSSDCLRRDIALGLSSVRTGMVVLVGTFVGTLGKSKPSSSSCESCSSFSSSSVFNLACSVFNLSCSAFNLACSLDSLSLASDASFS